MSEPAPHHVATDPVQRPATLPSTLESTFRRLIAFVSCGLLAATISPSFGAWHWLLDLASHFRWYYLVATAVALAASLVERRRWPQVLLAVAVAGNAWTMLPYWLPAPPAAVTTAVGSAAPPPQPTAPVSVITVNVLQKNQEKQRAVRYLRDRHADLVAVVEVDDAWAAALESLADIYPHRMVAPRTDNFGLAVLSRWPLAEQRVVEFVAGSYPNMVARIERPDGEFLFVATHPFPPYAPSHRETLGAHFRSVADFVTAAPLPCIVAGDYNATPWCAPFREFVARSGLRDTALGRGVQGSWNARLWLPRIPIDHILVPADATVLRRSLGPDIGSDHFPVEADLVLPVSR